MEHTTLLSLDSSTKSTGWALWKDGFFCESGVIDLSDVKDMDQRSSQMMIQILTLLTDKEPDLVVVERMHVTRNMKVVRALCEVIGAIRGWCLCVDSFFYELGPTEWRKAIGMKTGREIKRDEYKQLSKEYVAEKFNVKDVTDDESDAICIGNAYINIFTGIQGE